MAEGEELLKMLNEREFLTAVHATGDWLVRDMYSVEGEIGKRAV